MRNLTDKEKAILDYLETCYSGARMEDEESDSLDGVIAMTRIERAIAAFCSDPLLSPYSVFSEKFLENYFREQANVARLNKF